ncbi:MAG: hypothetical protein WCQ20_06040 [Synechococcaceae cyanobacterium ELA739]
MQATNFRQGRLAQQIAIQKHAIADLVAIQLPGARSVRLSGAVGLTAILKPNQEHSMWDSDQASIRISSHFRSNLLNQRALAAPTAPEDGGQALLADGLEASGSTSTSAKRLAAGNIELDFSQKSLTAVRLQGWGTLVITRPLRLVLSIDPIHTCGQRKQLSRA